MNSNLSIGDYLWSVDSSGKVFPVMVCDFDSNFLIYDFKNVKHRVKKTSVGVTLFQSRLEAEKYKAKVAFVVAEEIKKQQIAKAELRQKELERERQERLLRYDSMLVEDMIDEVKAIRREINSRLCSSTPARPACNCDAEEKHMASLALEELNCAYDRIINHGDGTNPVFLIKSSLPSFCALYRNLNTPELCDAIFEKLGGERCDLFNYAFYVSYAASFCDREHPDAAMYYLDKAADCNRGVVTQEMNSVYGSIMWLRSRNEYCTFDYISEPYGKIKPVREMSAPTKPTDVVNAPSSNSVTCACIEKAANPIEAPPLPSCDSCMLRRGGYCTELGNAVCPDYRACGILTDSDRDIIQNARDEADRRRRRY